MLQSIGNGRKAEIMQKTRAMFGQIYSFTKENMIRIRDQLGMTAVIPDEYTIHFSGFKLPPELTETGPLAGWRQRHGELARHQAAYGLGSNAWPVFPGVAGQADDTLIKKLIEEADALGMEVWGHIGLWGYTGDMVPEIGFRQVTDEPLPDPALHWGIPLCPNNDALIQWTGECLAYAASHYAIKEMDTDHGHFPPAASLEGIFGCTCHFCAEKAAQWGYSFAAMEGALRKLKSALMNITKATFGEACRKADDFMDFLVILAQDEALRDWFSFRFKSVSRHMALLTRAVHQAVGDACPVDSHYMPPSIAAFSGQRMAEWEQSIDRFTPGWGPVVGWDQTPALSIAAIARRFTAGGVALEQSLPELIRLFGYAGAGILPADVNKLEKLDYNINKALLHEIRLAKSQISPGKPCLYPFLLAGYDDESKAAAREALGLGGGSFVLAGSMEPEHVSKISAFLSESKLL
jgi:hypothetical protein